MDIYKIAYLIQKTLFAWYNILAVWYASTRDFTGMFHALIMAMIIGLVLKYFFHEGED